ncbi:hypothetical protein niasHT_006295 [Heterodera trifolii]|uniref:ATP-dependent RNA helicase n=1 Tax=Heterodera trifolii TaxID=157864 RepID=A0ABD2LRJ3_9BILA
MTAFEELGVLSELATALNDLEWTLPTDIQSEAIPAILGGGDVCMAAETGSGKTGAFCIPILQIVFETMLPSKPKRSGAVEDNGWRMNIFDRDHNLGIDASGFVCESNHPKLWSGSRSVRGVKGSGKYYYEATIESDGLCRMGWSTARANLNLGTDDQGWGFGGTGKKSHAGQFEDYGQSFTLGDTIGCFLDLEMGKIHFAKNGIDFPVAFALKQQQIQQGLFPAVVIKNARLRLNFGQTPLRFPPKGDWVALCRAVPACQIDSPVGTKGGQRTEGGGGDGSQARKPNAPMCLIVEPTKELAQQTYDQIERFRKYLDKPKIRSVLAVSGIPMGQQVAAINAGVDILTCTPGRIRGLVQEGQVELDQIRFFVLDEADSLLGGQSDSAQIVHELHSRIPKYSEFGDRLQMIVCSATLHNMAVQRLATQYMYFPQWIDLKGQDSVPETVHQVVCMVDPCEDKSWIRLRSKPGQSVQTDSVHARDQLRPGSDNPETLSEAVKVLKGEYLLKAIEEHKMDQAIVFCRTKLDCDNMEKFLASRGYKCVCLHGDRSADERTRNLLSFKEKKVRFLICTDVAARGLDIKGVPYVVNVTLPPAEEKANYVHRIGRVGRAERMGLAISLVSTVPEKVWYHQCRSRGANCNNTRLVEQGGCTKWFNELNYLGEVEEHLGVTISRVGSDMAVPTNEYDGKVVYGQKRTGEGGPRLGHAVEMSGVIAKLSEMERNVQINYLRLLVGK